MAHANAITKIAIALCSAMIVFMGCTKIEPDAPKMANNYDSNPQIVKVGEGEKVIRWDYKDLRMQFKNDQLEDSFIPVTVTNKEDKEGTRVAERFDVLAHGIMAQYFEPKTENFSEKEGATTTIAAEELDHQNGWVENRSGKVYSWDATNVDDAKDCPYSYRDSVWTASAVYTFVPDSLAGYKVNFPAILETVKAGEKKTEELNGIAYNGKTWNALKVSYPSTVTFTIPAEYRVSGGQYEMTKEIVNVVYYLRHEVKTTLEGLTYQVNILDGESIHKEYQTVDFKLVTRDNGEIKSNVPYRLEEEFNITATKVEDIEVYSEEALKNTHVDLTKGNITGKTESEDIFAKTTYNGSDKASMTDGRSTDVKIVYESYAWGETELPYASVTGRKAELKSVKNTAETTAAKVVYDVTLTLTYNIAYNNSDKKAETKVIVITYKRYMKVDNYEATVSASDYELAFEQPNESEMGTSIQRNTYHKVTTNNGEVVKDSTFTRDIAMSAKLTRTGAARKAVSEVKNLTVSIIPNGGDKTTYGQKDANGIQTMTVTRKYDVLTSDGATYELLVSDEKDIRGGNDFGHHASFADASFEPKVALQPTLNASESTANSQVYDVKVSVDMPVNRTDKVATKAAGDETFTVSASHQETLAVEDEYVSSREEWTVTPNGNGFDVKGELFETYTLSGEKSVDSKSGRLNASLTGINGSVKTVKNVNYSTNGNGHNGTGNGTYSDNASNGVSADSFNNEYNWSADGSLTLTLKGKGGKDASKTFAPTFAISEAGQSISNGTDKGEYTSYTYTNKVNGVYSVEGKNVNLSATDTRELRVEKEIETLVGNLIGAGMSVVPAHWSGNGFVDGSGKQRSTICLTLVKTDGSAAPIVFSHEVQTEQDKKDGIPFMIVPTDSQISGADFTAGSYDSTYNSGVYMNGKWVPAVAKDNSWGISYSIPSQKDIRSIRNESLKQWNWRNGNYSTKLNNYSVKVENGVCSIYYNGELVKSFR